MNRITPFLWFDNDAEDAAEFYVSIFKNSKILSKTLYQADTPSHLPVGSVMTVNFILDGQTFMALNGGPIFKFNESISFVVNCKDQEEIDYYWEKLSAVPQAEQCGWLKDKFGLSWQVVPDELGKLMNSGDAQKLKKVMDAMLKMTKIEIAGLQQAYEQK
jgi:predicted 3-demethylubiquinone-9 3-methyltransferase (glyoxalase superfamily)